MSPTCIDHHEEIQVGSPLPRATVRNAATGYLASCRDCQWMGLFPDGLFADDAVQTHYNRSHYGPSSYTVVFLADGTRAQCLEPTRNQLTPIQADRPTFPRTTGDVSDLVGRGDRIRLPGDREQMVVAVDETRTFGLATWSVAFCDPDVDLVDDDPDWRGKNELVARDADVYCRFGEICLGAPAFEIDGRSDHQADLSSFGDKRIVTDGGVPSSSGTEHDAVFRVFDATDRLGRKLIGWKWADGRQTMSPDEHGEADTLIEEAEDRVDPSGLDHGTVVARIWMDGEEIDRVDWSGRYTQTETEEPQ